MLLLPSIGQILWRDEGKLQHLDCSPDTHRPKGHKRELVTFLSVSPFLFFGNLEDSTVGTARRAEPRLAFVTGNRQIATQFQPELRPRRLATELMRIWCNHIKSAHLRMLRRELGL